MTAQLNRERGIQFTLRIGYQRYERPRCRDPNNHQSDRRHHGYPNNHHRGCHRHRDRRVGPTPGL